MKHISDRAVTLTTTLAHLVQQVARVLSSTKRWVTWPLRARATNVLALGVNDLVTWVPMMAQALHDTDRLRIKSLAMNWRLLTCSPNLSNRLIDRLYNDLLNLNALVVVNLKLLVDYARRSFNCNRLLRRFLRLVSTEERLLINLRCRLLVNSLFFLEAKKISIFLVHGSLVVLILVELNGR